MAAITGLRPFRYSKQSDEDLSRLIAPPYDVISPEELAEYRAIPCNITHLTLPAPSDQSSQYEASRQLLDQWIDTGLLVQDQEPALYIYQQEFSIPGHGEPYVRTGFLTGLRLVDFGEGGVLPHERTLSHHREDRRRLREAVEADLEPIFGMYRSGGVLGEVLAHLPENADVVVKDQNNVIHRLWRVADPDEIMKMRDALAEQSVYIVDGHHRYSTALEMARDHGFTDDDPLGSILIFLCSMDDPGLIIMPTHRIVHSVDSEEITRFLDGTSELFQFAEIDSVEKGFEILRSDTEDETRYLIMTSDRTIIATPTEQGRALLRESYGGRSLPLASLDVTILHDLLFERELGITKEMQESGTHLRYSRNDQEAVASIEEPDVQMVVAMNPPTIEQVQDVARSGEVMPQKSTYFFPKLASGLIIHAARESSSKDGML